MTTKSCSVAIVDDEASVLKGLKRLLDASSFRTETYDSAEAFLARGNLNDLSCIVLDVNMPAMSGIELRRRLKAMGSTIPVIFITALDTAAVRREATDLGCAGFLHKPFSGRELIGSVRKAMNCPGKLPQTTI
jgi:FixJ family two-component response regulator